MTIDAARKFFVKASKEPKWVQQLNLSESKAELDEKIAEYGLSFTYPEFDEAYNNILSKCQFPAQADALEQIRGWYDMLLSTLGDE